MKRQFVSAGILLLLCVTLVYADRKTFTNSIGMKFVRIEPGTFRMGQLKTLDPEVLPLIDKGHRGGRFDLMSDGNFDEKPVHSVCISKAFSMGMFEVTNKQFELFDPEHKKLRGKHGLSNDDDEAVIFVNWYDAYAFCKWLSDKEGLPYRLATEAEWEYACRAGTTTNFSMGDLPGEAFAKPRGRMSLPPPTPLHVGKSKPNPWGLYDMHGNVEEWCYDWYGPYVEEAQRDPVGYAEGDFRVSRGGSYATFPFFLRSANRLGMLPGDRNWLIGFRVVIGELPDTTPLPEPQVPLHQQNVIQRDPETVKKGPDPSAPYFKGPRKFLNIPRESIGPVYAGHNHNPAIAECPNGDLLAITYTCVSEKDRELAVAGTRLRYGSEEWETVTNFWETPDRNDHAPVLWYDDLTKKLFHFQPYSAGATYHMTLAIAMRTSSDSGATWTRVRILLPEHIAHETIRSGHQLSEPVIRFKDGRLAMVTDGMPTLWISNDEGLTWKSSNGTINCVHPGVVELSDGRLLGLARENEVRDGLEIVTEYEDFGKKYVHKSPKRVMARNYSSDDGKTWEQRVSPFPHIDGGQRLVLLRLREGPIMLASFANRGIIVTDSAGKKREVRGLYVALSEDEGKTWPCVKLVSDEGPGTPAMTTNGGYFIMSRRNAEYRGYMSGCQALNGVIHLVSSYSHYSFNLAWVKTAPKPLKHPRFRVQKAVETFSGPEFDLEGWEPYHGHAGGFNGKGQYSIISRSHFQGMNRILGEGSFEMNIALKNIEFNPRGDTASPGITIWIKDAYLRRLHFYVRDDRIDMGLFDEEERVKLNWKEQREMPVYYDTPPTSAKLKFVYNENTRQVRIFYGLNGNEATMEISYSKAGIYFGKPLSECNAAYIMFSNGSVDVDHYEVKPINP